MEYKTLKSSWLKIGLFIAMLAGSVAALASPDVIDAENFSGLDHGRAEALSGLIIRNLSLGDGESAELVLSRSEPFAPDAVLYRDGAVQGPLASGRVYFQGTSLSDGHAQVSLSIGSDGSLRGVLADGRGHWRLLSRLGRIDAALVSDEAVPGSREHDHFQCGLNSDIRQRSREAQRVFDLEHPPVQRIERNTDQRYRVRVAYDTTARFMNLFNTDQEAFDYLGDLTNYISLVYVRELNTEIVVSSTTSRRTNEPWNPDADDLLNQFENFWNDPANNVDQNRTLAHLVDAGPSQGVAYVGALCADGFDYGVSQGLGNEFDPNADPQGWSFTVVAHELGHNFGSDHTHCYDPVIDECYNGEAGNRCWAGAESLPTGGPAGQAPGTIMSYCHLLPGGLSNISVTLGRDHGFGVQPERVPDTMRAHVLDRAAAGLARCPQPVTTGASFLVSTNVQGNGAISPTSTLVAPDETASFTLTPAAGNTVQSASGCNGNLQGNTFTTGPITAACTVSVVFSEQISPSFLVSTQVQGSGTITPTSADVTQGETASFTLTPAAGAAVEDASGCDGTLQGNNTYTTGAINEACTVSVAFSQTTAPDPLCAVVNQGFPDNSAQGISSTVSVNDGGTIDKLEVLLDIEHTWVGDLIIDLRHDASSTSVRLVDRPGGTGCSGDDIKVTLDDEAGLSIQDDCQDAAAFPQARYRPANPLSGYDGLSIAGDWTLTVSDNAEFDTGQLLRWCLIPTTSGGIQIEIFADRFQQQ